MYNLNILPYILSKFSVLSFFSIIQSAIFVFILHLWFNDNNVNLTDPLSAFYWMSFLSISATFLGLFLSSIMSTTEKVMTIVPVVLMPQIMLAGLVAKINSEFVEFISYLTLSRWGTEGFNIIQDVIISQSHVGNGEVQSKARDVLMSNFHKSYKSNFENAGTIELDICIISIMTIIFILSIYISLKKKDSVSL